MTFRVMGPHERGRFEPDAWGQLLLLRDAGALSPADFEYIVERALGAAEGRVQIEDVHALLDSVDFPEESPPAREVIH